MNKISAVIIDDETDSIALLALQLGRSFPQIEIVKTYTSSLQAVDELLLVKPDLVFLDIEMPYLNGFELLEKLSPISFKTIFITAYNQYAIRAFKFNALDYIVKPFSTDDIKSAIEKAEAAVVPNMQQLDFLKRQMKGEAVNKIAVSSQSGIIFIELNDILYVEASGNYSKLVIPGKKDVVISKTLKDIQDILETRNFFRIHRQYIINLNKVKHFNRVDSILSMDNGDELPVARIQKDKLTEKFDWL